MADKIVRLVDTAPGFAVDGHEGLAEWLELWAKALRSGDYGSLRSCVVVLESSDGQMAVLSQSVKKDFDRVGVAGLLSFAKHYHADGLASIDKLKVKNG